jgi:transposase InsO family protein
VIDFVKNWSAKTELPMGFFTRRLGISRSKLFDWQKRYGCENRHNGSLPRDFWLEDWEKQAIIDFYGEHPLEGYRRCCYMMIDEDLVAVSPATVYRVLKQAGAMRRWNGRRSKKGQGFNQPGAPHEHWHVDVSYVNISGTFFYLCSILDGYSRYIVHWELRESMLERDVQIIIQRAREQFPGVSPRIISDNGPQFTARDFKEFIRISGMTHVRTSPYYPQSNGKLERYHKTIKGECIRPQTPLSGDEARRVIGRYVDHYCNVRLHSAIGYVTPKAKLEGREKEIHALRDRRLQEARQRRRQRRRDAKDDRSPGQQASELAFACRTDTPQDGRGSQVEAGISAPCGPSEQRERGMPEVHLTEPAERGTGYTIEGTQDEAAPTLLTANARESSSR